MADFNLSLPGFSDLDDAKQRRQMKSYLYQLTEQLRYVLNNLDGDNMSTVYVQNMERIRTTAEVAEQLAKDLEDEVEVNYRELFDKIVQSADEITSNYTVSIDTMGNSILTQVGEEYTAKGETSSLEQRLMSLIEQTSRDITFKFDQATEYTVELNGEIQKFIDQVRSYQRFTADGLEIGKEGSPFQSQFSNTELRFLQNGERIAYVSNNKLYITNVEVTNHLTIGNASNGYFEFRPRANGNLSLKWRSS